MSGVAPRFRQRLLQGEHSGLHFAADENPPQYHSAEKHLEYPRNLELMPVERAGDKIIQMIAHLREVPRPGLVVSPLQAVEFRSDGVRNPQTSIRVGSFRRDSARDARAPVGSAGFAHRAAGAARSD